MSASAGGGTAPSAAGRGSTDGFVVRALAAGAIGALVAALLYRSVLFFAAGAEAVGFPYNLDYGEGIVWQQLLLMARGQAYGDIAGFPSIVFHYPPLYHALAALLAGGTGLDQLAAGRLLSLLAALAAAAAVGALVFHGTRGAAGRVPGLLCGCVAGLVALTHWPVAVWAPLMRVDMVAVALSVLGVCFGVRSPERPRLVHAAALCFVAAVYTKQTALAAPFATFFVLALVRPGLAVAGVATCVVVGGLLVGALTWATDGGFLRHLVLYNINRFDLSRLGSVGAIVAAHALYAVAVAIALARAAWRLTWRVWAGAGIAGLRRRLASDERSRILAVAAAYLALTTATLAGVGKSGSAANYFVEWMCVWSVFIGFAAWDAAILAAGQHPLGDRACGPRPRVASPLLAILVPMALAAQALALPSPLDARRTQEPAQAREMRELVDRVAGAAGPVVSDDMVLVLRAGKPVVWEPAIFAELASVGRWDEGRFLAMIEARAFAFFVTTGYWGDATFESRYTPSVGRALDAAYPRKERRAGYVLHLPDE